MAVYEVKDTKPVPATENLKPRRRDVKPVLAGSMVRPIDFLRLSVTQDEKKKKDWQDQDEQASFEGEKTAKTIIRHINQQLESLNIPIHLTLHKGDDGYSLDVHDCQDGKVCTKVAEEPVNIDELPNLLRRLKQQAGILVDKKM